MLAHRCKKYFPESAHDEGNSIHGQEIRSAEHDIIPDAGGIVRSATEQDDQCFTPAFQNSTITGIKRKVRLQTNVVHAEKHCRKRTHPDCNHDAFEVDTITHMRRVIGHTRRRIKTSIHCFVQGIHFFVLATLFKFGSKAVEHTTQAHN